MKLITRTELNHISTTLYDVRQMLEEIEEEESIKIDDLLFNNIDESLIIVRHLFDQEDQYLEDGDNDGDIVGC